MTKGIDVSSFQGTINWSSVKNSGIEFAILRTGFGSPSDSQIDSKFYDNLQGCSTVGMPTGAYHYGYATSETEAVTEAKFCLAILKGADMPYCVWYDVEDSTMLSLGNQRLTDIINAFCSTVNKAGYQAGVYMNVSAAENNVYMDQIPYRKWIAQYYDYLQYEGEYDIWQYTSSGDVEGINGTVDMDLCYTDFSDKSNQIVWKFDTDVKKWYAERNGERLYTWVYDTGNWYYLGLDGYMQTGWVNDGGSDWYYCRPDSGEMMTGWIWDKNYKGWYYLDPTTGKMVTGWVQYEGYEYYCNPLNGGKMAANEYIQDGGMTKYWLSADGKWIP